MEDGDPHWQEEKLAERPVSVAGVSYARSRCAPSHMDIFI